MAVLLTGDTHGRIDFGKVRDLAARAGGRLTRSDYLIILGDFGFVWNDATAQKDAESLDWLESCPWTTLFLDGNHENFDVLDALPALEWHGGRVQAVRPHILHLMRGEKFQIGGHSFFVVGGAHSVDADVRTPHVSWWEQEVPDQTERERIAASAREVGQVDYVLTHCPPTGQYLRYKERFPRFWGPSDEYTDWLEQNVEGAFAYKRWFFGHLHIDHPLDSPYTALYQHIFDLDHTGLTPYCQDMGPCEAGGDHEWAMRWERLSPPADEPVRYSRKGRPIPPRDRWHSWYQCEKCGCRVEL